jgi:hypothetical protein
MGGEARDAFDKPVQSNANSTETVRAAKPAPEVRVGSSIHKRGYSDGFSGADYSNSYNYGSREHNAYDVGYEAGVEDRENGDPARYRYVQPTGWTRNTDGKVTPPPGTVFRAQGSDWPFPTKG